MMCENEKYIDLHIHTTRSDGKMTVEEMLEAAKAGADRYADELDEGVYLYVEGEEAEEEAKEENEEEEKTEEAAQ